MSFLAEVLVHTGFFLGFLPLFFFFYVSPTQEVALTNDFFDVIKPYLNSILSVVDTKNIPQVEGGVHDIQQAATEKLSSFSERVQSDNSKIIKYTAIAVGITAPLLILIGCLIEAFSGGDLVKFLISNLIVLAFIAVSEFAIVGLFVKNFIEIDGSVIAAIFEDKIDNPYGGCWYSNRFMRTILPTWLADFFLKYTPPPE